MYADFCFCSIYLVQSVSLCHYKGNIQALVRCYSKTHECFCFTQYDLSEFVSYLSH